VCFIVHKTISELEHAILTIMFLPVQKTPTHSLSSIHTGLHALIELPKHYTFRIWVYTWLVLLSHAVLSVVQVFHLYDVEYGLCLCESIVVSHPSRCELAM
jgi:hypothetical protein